MRKHAWEYRYSVRSNRGVYSEPYKRTDDLKTAIRAARRSAKTSRFGCYVWDAWDNIRIYAVRAGLPKTPAPVPAVGGGHVNSKG